MACKANLIRFWEIHPDCKFTAFTNSSLIDEAFCHVICGPVPCLLRWQDYHYDAEPGSGRGLRHALVQNVLYASSIIISLFSRTDAMAGAPFLCIGFFWWERRAEGHVMGKGNTSVTPWGARTGVLEQVK